jgi:hypothetical protein
MNFGAGEAKETDPASRASRRVMRFGRFGEGASRAVDISEVGPALRPACSQARQSSASGIQDHSGIEVPFSFSRAASESRYQALCPSGPYCQAVVTGSVRAGERATRVCHGGFGIP